MSKQTKFPKYTIQGVEIDAVTLAQATDYITNLAVDAQSPACYVIKPYVEFLVAAKQREVIRRCLNDAELSLADGVALTWAAYYLFGGSHNMLRWFWSLCQIIISPAVMKRVLPERFAGIKATWKLLEACQAKDLRVFLVGSPKNQSIEQTGVAIKKRLPSIQIVGHFKGYFEAGDKERLYGQLREHKPDVILVGMGFPKQELLMAEIVSNKIIPHGVLVGEGGSFDYEGFGGALKKAPALVQQVGLEWLWRLILEPSRIGRQLAVPRFAWRIYRQGRKI
jgi:N-acetylglucosaminyldiphosphoundecaprenol N-acetyl-beta-D-mannosaminyltransferase